MTLLSAAALAGAKAGDSSALQNPQAAAYPAPTGHSEWGFMEDLKKREPFRPKWTRKAGENELPLDSGFSVDDRFGIARANLDTALAELRAFFDDIGVREAAAPSAGGDSNRAVPIVLKRGKVAGAESYRLSVGKGGIELVAEDSEGMRRAVYFLENRIAAQQGAFLPYGVVERKPWLENRISRCFFGPIKRPPFNRDELLDDINYYPDEYLNRLAREGINGLWLTVELRDLAETSFTKRDPLAKKRLAKLEKTVRQCARYGIKTWLFFIEPAPLGSGDKESLFKAHPNWRGARGWGDNYAMCTSNKEVLQYIEESLSDIFAHVPNLAGAINISHGERITNCLSTLPAEGESGQINCPRCANRPKGEIHSETVGAMLAGMRKHNPKAQFISWLYQPSPQAERPDWVCELADGLPYGAVVQYNFESGALAKQLGRWRSGGDYWLSYRGASPAFVRFAEAARRGGAALSAKIQVGNSHEMATVPFVPAPGLLYDKYRQMKKRGCSSVMQCWYFGNYPGVMNEAAGELAFENFDTSRGEFLRRLAKPVWGDGEAAERIAKIWEAYSDGYTYYPLSNNMQYYGPMHAGVVWPLYFDIGMRPLSPTWEPDFAPNGETIGDALENHTIDEALALADAMCARLRKADADVAALEKSLRPDDAERLADMRVIRAMKLQIESARNIFEFYKLRRDAYYASRAQSAPKKAAAMLGKMAEIAKTEIKNSADMARLCDVDSRLGFHSEAETHLYSSARLRWRIGTLQDTLSKIADAKKILESGGVLPESDFEKNAPKAAANGQWNGDKYTRWRIIENAAGAIDFEAELFGDYAVDNFTVIFTDAAGTVFPWEVSVDKNGNVRDFRNSANVSIEKTENGGRRIKLMMSDLPESAGASRPAWIFVRRDTAGGKNGAPDGTYTWPKCEKFPPWRLNIGPFTNNMFGKCR